MWRGDSIGISAALSVCYDRFADDWTPELKGKYQQLKMITESGTCHFFLPPLLSVRMTEPTGDCMAVSAS